jgi:hypothetical protein
VHWGSHSVPAWREWRRWFDPQAAALDGELSDEEIKGTALRLDEIMIGCAIAKAMNYPGRIGLSYSNDNMHVLRVLVRHVRPHNGVSRDVVERAMRYCHAKACVEVMREVIMLAMKLGFDVDVFGTSMGITESWQRETRLKADAWAAETMPESFQPAEGTPAL